ncbi:unnamed protein product [Prunus armeniaca]|uniref:CASP-like protein n=1 Tax=Prunus armeniaca TaxID=36596 RepID=A0A6J5THT2_PRUAR|nr:unnamed protein product [Prunus armeniaca]
MDIVNRLSSQKKNEAWDGENRGFSKALCSLSPSPYCIKATFRDLKALLVLVYVVSVAAGYNLLQLGKCSKSAWYKENLKGSNIYVAWLCFLLDQVAVYVTFGANSAALEASVLAIKGAQDFQWMKLCNKYTRFCFQIGGALACGYVACILMAWISLISAFNLFRLYSPKKFLLLKSRA